MKSKSFPLAPAIRGPVERQFGVDLSAVRVVWSGLPRELGAVAVARGGHIHLDASLDTLPRAALRRVLAHEVAHLLQQRQGRVAPTRERDGVPINDDLALELEAETFARDLAAGRRPRLAAGPFLDAAPPVAQCLITVGGVPIKSYDDLSEKARLLLGLVDCGEDYVRWAIQDTHGTIAAADEAHLLDIVVGYLTGGPLLWVGGIGLLAAPAALLQIDPVDDLELLLHYDPAKDGKNVVAAQAIRRILGTYRLRLQSVATDVQAFLVQIGVDQSPLFQFLGLDAVLRIYDLVNAVVTPVDLVLAIQRDAALFALDHATSPTDWVAWYQLYMNSSNGLPNPTMSTQLDRSQRVEAFLVILPVPCFSWIRCPSCPTVDFGLSDTDLVAAVRAIPQHGGEIYFASLATVMYHVIKHTAIAPDSPNPAAIVNAYGQAAQTLIGSTAVNIAVTVNFDQGGLSRSILFDSPTERAVVKVFASGVVVLATYFPKT